MWRGEHDLEPVHNVGEVHIAYETGKSLFTCTLAGIRNIFLNLELALFHLKCMASTKQLLTTDFFGSK
jgi:hypothetical protein